MSGAIGFMTAMIIAVAVLGTVFPPAWAFLILAAFAAWCNKSK